MKARLKWVRALVVILAFQPEALARQAVTIQFDKGSRRIVPDAARRAFWKASWRPTGEQEIPLSHKCNPETFEQNYLYGFNSERRRTSYLKRYFRNCERELHRGAQGGITQIINLEKTKYKYFSHPNIRSFRLDIPDVGIVDGLVAIKDNNRKRPFVLIKCGLHCRNGEAGPDKQLLMHLFDESPFNVMILGSHSGSNIAIANNRVTFGGFYEGQEIYHVGRWLLEESPFRDKIESLHLIGTSLGGHAALYASLYNDHNPVAGEKIFNSVIAYCPVVRLKPTVKEIYKMSGRGLIMGDLTWKSLKEIHGKVDDVQDLYTPYREREKGNMVETRPPVWAMPNIFFEASFRFLRRQKNDTFLHPFMGEVINEVSDVWRLNDFVANYEELQTPTLVVASKDDWLVPYKTNAKRLIPLQNHNSNMKVLSFNRGNHCALSSSYGWKATSALFRSYILNNSNYLDAYQEVEHLDLPPINANEVHDFQVWKAKKNKSYLELKFVMAQGEKAKKVRIPLSKFGRKVPRGHNQAYALTRWANNQLVLVNEEKSMFSKAIRGKPTAGSPTKILIKGGQ